MRVPLCRQGLSWFETPIDIKGKNIKSSPTGFPKYEAKGKDRGLRFKIRHRSNIKK